jgi:hypothetical protein
VFRYTDTIRVWGKINQYEYKTNLQKFGLFVIGITGKAGLRLYLSGKNGIEYTYLRRNGYRHSSLCCGIWLVGL